MIKFEKVSYEKWYEDVKKYFMSAFSTDEEIYKCWQEIQLPKRSTSGSAGYDFFMPMTVTLPDHCTRMIPSGIKWRCEDEKFYMCLMLYIRSSLSIKHGINVSQSVAVIDADYYNNQKNEGDILLPLRNDWSISHKLKQGERVVQGVITQFAICDGDSTYASRIGGVGSTGR